MTAIRINEKQVLRMKQAAKDITEQIHQFISRHSSVSVERAVLRLYGVDGINSEGTPLPNCVVDKIDDTMGITDGVSKIFSAAILKTGLSPQETAEQIKST